LAVVGIDTKKAGFAGFGQCKHEKKPLAQRQEAVNTSENFFEKTFRIACFDQCASCFAPFLHPFCNP
jgi:hypothetical protein